MARSKSHAIGPAMRSASARSASASIRTTVSATFFMRKKIPASGSLTSLCRFRRHGSVRVEDQYAFLVGAAGKPNRLAVKRHFHSARIAGKEDNLIVGADGLYVGRTDDAPDCNLTVRLDRHPRAIFGTHSDLKRLTAVCGCATGR